MLLILAGSIGAGKLIDHLPGSRTVIGHVVIVCQIVELVGPLGVADQVINPFLHRHLTPDLPPASPHFRRVNRARAVSAISTPLRLLDGDVIEWPVRAITSPPSISSTAEAT